MNVSELALGAYTKLHAAFGSDQDQLLSQLLGYEHPQRDRAQPNGPHEFIYDLQERDFSRELINTFNRYAYRLNRLALWEKVLRDDAEDEVHELRLEFTELPLDDCLHAPYSFKSRIIFCATQLCYTKAIFDHLITKDRMKPAEKINIAALRAVANHWPAGLLLIESLEAIDDDRHRELTGNYRNKAQHRHPPRLDHGYTADIVRNVKPSSVSYSFGETPPLNTNNLLPVLADQAKLMVAGFFAYRALVDEHRA